MRLDLYVITDGAIGGGRSHAEIARFACAGGADAIQLRDKACGPDALCRIGREIRAITRDTGTLFIVNDRLDVALACGADGVHLGQGDLRVDTARRLAPRPFMIGVSVGNAEEAISAVVAGADYVAASPIFATSSKDDAGPGCGISGLREIRAAVAVPVVAIGGITRDNVAEVIAGGADSIAVISAVVGQPDIVAAARDLRERITTAKEQYREKRDA
ncbi:thiamine-phosphate pyrophosphorylase [Methanoregula boonei 6A8]|jgi:thiamine-phosphate pyrophosphorylase|uniref:Thiamine-phosphate synthase n=1 Tax=Methanoregula boonei (strain DSM 21154 / JCM 14090 / 6A8) TaxID=456442 RepID=THIE_METB6|nr:thiamine phosphate synthase [Methanoregula boonei]A7IA09.1 RecName: Full=Thiamine-phosphate synthase; Short=TP synthase; Short=TPS; AltName: Full=Thiamine-phosphate pyrophosphorylase; Short=TMP pyrophosphorylase; Short=TMP-PPase [Methanoregula boonei 6A8]ABS56570.1 thiamine-phosphate pyrophosphorylase [Methanoregula boonei 6A8]